MVSWFVFPEMENVQLYSTLPKRERATRLLTNRRDVHVALGDGLQPLFLLALEPRELKVLVPGLVHLCEESPWNGVAQLQYIQIQTLCQSGSTSRGKRDGKSGFVELAIAAQLIQPKFTWFE